MLSSSFRKPTPFLGCLIFLFIAWQGHSQTNNIGVARENYAETEAAGDTRVLLSLMQQIDSVSLTPGLASHFAKIYAASMSNIKVQLEGLDSGARGFVKKFEITFISYFLDACAEFNNGTISPGSIWYFYFSHPEAQPWQSTMIGVNAHINGDIWKGLVKNFSEQEIRRYKKSLLSFQSSISKAFQPFFEELLEQSAYLRFINNFTQGTARRYGEWLIYNWRLRQINLAMTYYTDREKFNKRFAVIKKKKKNIDEMILRNRKLPMF